MVYSYADEPKVVRALKMIFRRRHVAKMQPDHGAKSAGSNSMIKNPSEREPRDRLGRYRQFSGSRPEVDSSSKLEVPAHDDDH